MTTTTGPLNRGTVIHDLMQRMTHHRHESIMLNATAETPAEHFTAGWHSGQADAYKEALVMAALLVDGDAP